MCFPQPPLPQEFAPSSRLVRYAVGNGPCFSNSPDAPSASCEPARHSSHPGNNFGSPAWLTRLAAIGACSLYGNRVLGNSTGVASCDNREEKVPYSSGTCPGFLLASSVPKSKGTSIGNRCREAEENPTRKKTQDGEEGRRFFSESFEENPPEEDPILNRQFCVRSVSALAGRAFPRSRMAKACSWTSASLVALTVSLSS